MGEFIHISLNTARHLIEDTDEWKVYGKYISYYQEDHASIRHLIHMFGKVSQRAFLETNIGRTILLVPKNVNFATVPDRPFYSGTVLVYIP